MHRRARVLYITYDGILEPIPYSQGVEYLKRLSLRHHIEILSFEKSEHWKDVDRRNALTKELADAQIRWTALRYHKRPSVPATMFDLIQGAVVGVATSHRGNLDTIHARGYIAAMIGRMIKNILNQKIIFDTRGFWVDERAEDASTSLSKDSRLYRILKSVERDLFLHSDAVVCQTKPAVHAVHDIVGRDTGHVHLIRNSTNLDRFLRTSTPNLSKRDSLTLGIVGTVTGHYNFKAMLYAYRALRLRCADAKLLILNVHEHAYIKKELSEAALSNSHVEVLSARGQDLVQHMHRMDAAVFFIQPTFAQLNRAPTKLGELLACGVPVITNAGIGDTEDVLTEHNCGIVIPDVSDEHIERGVDNLLRLLRDKSLPTKCVSTSKKVFAINTAIDQYDKLYGTPAF